MKKFIGIDIGTTGTRCGIYTAEGTPVSESFVRTSVINENGVITQDPHELFSSVISTMGQALGKLSVEDRKDVSALAVDAQMAGIIGIDENGNSVMPYDSWLDNRCGEVLESLKSSEEEIIRKSGGQITCAHAAKILWWKRNRPETFSKVAKFVTLSAYITLRLCNKGAKDAYIDYTHLHFSGFADNANLTWDDGLLAGVGLTRDILPEITAPTRRIGTLGKAVSDAVGLSEDVEVFAGAGDTAASSLGAGVTDADIALDVAGTASVYSCSTTEFKPDTENRTIMYARSVIDGLWIPLAYISGGGMCLEWFSELSGMNLAELDEMAVRVGAGSENLLFLPHFSGRTCPADPRVKGMFSGLSFNHKKAHMFRAVMESIGYEYRYYQEIIGNRPQKVYVIGGGGKSNLFNSIKADILGATYVIPDSRASATFGMAMLAGYAEGSVGDLKRAVALSADGVVAFDGKRHAEYSVYYKRYEKLLDISGKYYEELVNNG